MLTRASWSLEDVGAQGPGQVRLQTFTLKQFPLPAAGSTESTVNTVGQIHPFRRADRNPDIWEFARDTNKHNKE